MVTFYDGDDLTAKVLGQYGGSKARFKLYTSTADATIQFQSDPATNVYGYGNGFIVHFFGKLRHLQGEGALWRFPLSIPPPTASPRRSFNRRILSC